MRVAERLIETEGTLDGERVAMSIDTDALQHIMSVLTDLYSDPELAIIREYSTNALDSHIEAGNARPIEVSTPSQLMPFLRIRDFGVGLDAEGIRTIYSQYGTSTKRDSDDVVGMLGLGCKSALTYCDQFTLVGYKDGVMTTVAVGRDEQGTGVMTIMDVSDTDEPNGLEVVIPAKRDNDLADKAAAFFGWWTPGTVLLNDKQPQEHERTWIVPGRAAITGYDSHVVVMGNVAYPLSDEHAVGLPKLPRDRAVAFFVNIGEVNFTPSREALQYTKRTRETVAALSEQLATEYHKALAESIVNADNYREAILAWREAEQLGLPKEKAVWRGQPVATTLNRQPVSADGHQRYVSADDYTSSFLIGSYRTGYGTNRRKSGERTWSVAIVQVTSQYDYEQRGHVTHASTTRWFDGFDGKALTDVKRAKIEKYLDLSDTTKQNERWVFVDKLTADEKVKLGGSQIIAWADVDAVKLTDSNGRPKKKLAGSYHASPPQGVDKPYRTETTADELDPDKILWVSGNRYNADRTRQRSDVPADHWIVALPTNRVVKFQRDFPKAKLVTDYLKEQALAAFQKLPREERLAGAAASMRIPDWLRKVTTDADPDVTALAAMLVHPRRAAAAAVLDAYNAHTIDRPTEYKEVLQLHDRIVKRYPLLDGVRYGNIPAEHIDLYVTAVNAAKGV